MEFVCDFSEFVIYTDGSFYYIFLKEDVVYLGWELSGYIYQCACLKDAVDFVCCDYSD